MRLIDADALAAALLASGDGAAQWAVQYVAAAPTVACGGCEYSYRGHKETHPRCQGCECGSNFERRAG